MSTLFLTDMDEIDANREDDLGHMGNRKCSTCGDYFDLWDGFNHDSPVCTNCVDYIDQDQYDMLPDCTRVDDDIAKSIDESFDSRRSFCFTANGRYYFVS